jgi:hypothetical protein
LFSITLSYRHAEQEEEEEEREEEEEGEEEIQHRWSACYQ